jgi:hypothetical protein
VLFSNTVGIGTAGTVDERLLDEIAATRVPQTNDRPGGIRALQPLSDADSREILLSWPSGKEFSLALVKEQAAVRIDVLASPGGEILLINR